MDPVNPYATTPSGLGREEPGGPFGPPPWPEQGGIPFEGTLTYEDFLHAQRLHAGARGSMLVPAILCLLWAILMFLSLALQRKPVALWEYWFLGLPVLVVPVLLLRRLRIRRLWASSKLNGQPMAGHISEVGVELRLPILEARMTWSAYLRSKADDDLLLLYQQPATFNMFPKRFFRDDADWRACRELIEQHLGG
jgi:hypothetical protein